MFVLTLNIGYCIAQDTQISQFTEAAMNRNPSLAGIFNGDVRLQSVYRSQWPVVDAPFITSLVSAEFKRPVGRGTDFFTAGFQVMYDHAGAVSFATLSILPVFNYHKSLGGYNNAFLSLGFMGGYVQRSLDRNKIITNNQYDGEGYNPSLPDGEALTQFNYHYIDGSAGVSFNASLNQSLNENYYIGIAYHHFNRPKNSFYGNPVVELNPRLVFSSGIRFNAGDDGSISIESDFSKQGAFNLIMAGCVYSRKIRNGMDAPVCTLALGSYIRWADSFIPVLKLEYNPFVIAFSYDINISDAKELTKRRSGLEFSVGYKAFSERSRHAERYLNCPSF
jgi:type IX secretion system PorP/SprF family membrane protein